MDEQAKLERAQNAKLMEHQPATDMEPPERALEMLETRGVEETEAVTGEADLLGTQADERECPLLGVKRTSLMRDLMSANDPNRTFVQQTSSG
jgi:hypothetical protein